MGLLKVSHRCEEPTYIVCSNNEGDRVGFQQNCEEDMFRMRNLQSGKRVVGSGPFVEDALEVSYCSRKTAGYFSLYLCG